VYYSVVDSAGDKMNRIEKLCFGLNRIAFAAEAAANFVLDGVDWKDSSERQRIISAYQIGGHHASLMIIWEELNLAQLKRAGRAEKAGKPTPKLTTSEMEAEVKAIETFNLLHQAYETLLKLEEK
jgi:hypothetical protein